LNYVLEYWQAIEAGQVVVSRRVRQIYERLTREIENPGRYVFDLEKASKPIRFIETFCRHSKGEDNAEAKGTGERGRAYQPI